MSTTDENLRAAAMGEHEEWSELYPHFAEIAEKEGFKKIATAFKLISKIEAEHELEVMCRNVTHQLNVIGNSAVDAIDRSGLSTSDIVRGVQGPFTFFHKVAAISEKDEQLPEMNSYVRKILEESSMEAWCSTSIKKDVNRKGLVISLAEGVLKPSLIQINDLYTKHGLRAMVSIIAVSVSFL